MDLIWGPLLAGPTLPQTADGTSPVAPQSPAGFLLTLLARPLQDNDSFIHFLHILASQDILDASPLIQRTLTHVLTNLSWADGNVVSTPKLITALLTLQDREPFREQVEEQAGRGKTLRLSASNTRLSSVPSLYNGLETLSLSRVPDSQNVFLPTGLRELQIID